MSGIEAAHGCERVDALDGLRGLMAWAVAAYHFDVLAHAFEPGGLSNSALVVLGLHSVGAFFMVSGFCLHHRYAELARRPAAVADFYRQRFVRIAPVFYLALALNLILQTPLVLRASPLHWLENLSLCFGLHHPNRALVTGGWSIGVEWLFYFAFPVLVWCVRSWPGICLASLAAIGLAALHGAQRVVGSDAERFAAYVLPQNHAFAFLLGVLLSKLHARLRLRIGLPVALALACAGAALWLASRPRVVDHFQVVLGAPRTFYAAVSFGLIGLLALTRAPAPRARRLLCAAGDLSYPVYLLHPLAFQLNALWLPRGLNPRLTFVAALLTTFVLAAGVRRYYERPIQSRFARGRRPALSGAKPGLCAREPTRAALAADLTARSEPGALEPVASGVGLEAAPRSG